MAQPLQRRIVRGNPHLLFGCHDRTLPGVVLGFGRFSSRRLHQKNLTSRLPETH
jgi:hypothetical protein